MIIDVASFQPNNPVGFIVLEGVNGAGKSTLQKSLCKHIQARGREPLASFEPGATPLGKALRNLLLSGHNRESGAKPSPLAELFLFAADRAEHVQTVISPALARKALVILDRYFYSTLAFQGYGRGLDLDLISAVNRAAAGKCLPDLVLLLDLDPQQGLRRNTSSGSLEEDAFEKEDLEFHRRLRSGFLEIAESAREPFALLDAGKSAQEVLAQAVPFIDKLMDNL